MRPGARFRAAVAAWSVAACLVVAGARAGAQTSQPAVPDSAATPPAAREKAEAPVDRPLLSPTRAVCMTPLFPGWGQLYCRSSWRAALAFGAETFYWSQLLKNDRKAQRWRTFGLSAGTTGYERRVEEYRERVRDYAWWSLGALLIIALDAYVDANLYGFDTDPVPVPDQWDPARAGVAEPPVADADFAVVLWRAGF